MEDEGTKKQDATKVVHTYPLIRHSDMSEEAQLEISDMVATACEKFTSNNEGAAKLIKDEMDKKFGPPFHVVVGEAFGFEVSYECGNILYMFFGGNLAVVIWKC